MKSRGPRAHPNRRQKPHRLSHRQDDLPRQPAAVPRMRSEEHTSELQSRQYLHSFPTRRSSDLEGSQAAGPSQQTTKAAPSVPPARRFAATASRSATNAPSRTHAPSGIQALPKAFEIFLEHGIESAAGDFPGVANRLAVGPRAEDSVPAGVDRVLAVAAVLEVELEIYVFHELDEFRAEVDRFARRDRGLRL